MSTRCITHIYDNLFEPEKIVCSFYRHCDGYPSGHGEDLKDWLQGKRIVNGIRQDFKKGVDYNGIGSLAVELMADLQKDTSIRTIPTGQQGMGEEYTYRVRYINEGWIVSYMDDEVLESWWQRVKDLSIWGGLQNLEWKRVKKHRCDFESLIDITEHELF